MKMKKNKAVSKITHITPSGIQVLIEHLTPQEIVSNKIIVSEKSDVGTPQAYVLAIGPGLEGEKEKLGFKVGDRVIVQGKYIPLPKLEGQTRELGIITYTDIKAVLHEDVE
jgi:co-chaperonin GroES (HSP10)